MKEYILWIILYGVYWYISTIIGNMLYDVTKINWINDVARMFFPFIFLGITYMVLKLKNKKINIEENTTVKISENKITVNTLKTIGIVFGAFFFAIFLVMTYVIISLK